MQLVCVLLFVACCAPALTAVSDARRRRQIDTALLDDLHAKVDEHKRQWDDKLDEYRKWHEQQARQAKDLLGGLDVPLLRDASDDEDDFEERQERWEDSLDRIKQWHAQHLANVEPLLGSVAQSLDAQRNWDANIDKLKMWHETLQPLFAEKKFKWMKA